MYYIINKYRHTIREGAVLRAGSNRSGVVAGLVGRALGILGALARGEAHVSVVVVAPYNRLSVGAGAGDGLESLEAGIAYAGVDSGGDVVVLAIRNALDGAVVVADVLALVLLAAVAVGNALCLAVVPVQICARRALARVAGRVRNPFEGGLAAALSIRTA